jgi:hypothetical protein
VNAGRDAEHDEPDRSQAARHKQVP